MATVNIDFTYWAQGIALPSDTGSEYTQDAEYAAGMPVVVVSSSAITAVAKIIQAHGLYVGSQA